MDAAGYRETRLTLAGDDRLLLVSDGLVERGPGGLSTGLDELRAAVAGGPVAPQALLDAVLTALDPPRTDDVTLLALART
nr:SpoIIE family protein phosphatase [Blastococcus sp. DSM 46786]